MKSFICQSRGGGGSFVTAWLQSLEEDVGIPEIPRKIFGLYKSSQERHVGLMWVRGGGGGNIGLCCTLKFGILCRKVPEVELYWVRFYRHVRIASMARIPFLHFVPPHISRLRRNARNVPKVEPQMDLTVSRFWSSSVERPSCSLALICFGPSR